MNNELKNALNALKSGGIVLFQTDTIWGIGCDALSDVAAQKIFKIKKRDKSKALICLASSFEMIKKYALVKEVDNFIEVSNQTPTTFIFDNPKKISNYVTAHKDTVAFRVPHNSFCIDLIKLFGRPIVSTSANLSGQKVPLNFSDIDAHIKDNVDYIVKNEKNKNSFASSRILRLNDDGSFYKIR